MGHQTAQVTESKWGYGLCGCLQDVGICCDVFWCGTCVLARQCDSVVEDRQDSFPAAVCCGLFLCQAFVGGLATCAFTWMMRDKTRDKYSVNGSAFGDCCASCFCTACVVCQMQREILRRGHNPGHCCCSPSNPPEPIQREPAQPGYNGGYGNYGNAPPVAYPVPQKEV